MIDARPDSVETIRLLERVAVGDSAAVNALLAAHRDGLRNFVAGRLDPAVRTRVDASDVVQEALAEVARRLPDFLSRRPMPFHLWARKMAYERALKVRREHRAQIRDIGREAHPRDPSLAELIHSLAVQGPTPSEAAQGNEAAQRIERALADLSEADREILLLRQIDRLSHGEIASLLEIDPTAARQRYGRALIRLEHALSAHGVNRNEPNERPAQSPG